MKCSWFRRKNSNQRKEGASLVSVVIGILFLAAIGASILTVATRYAVSVYTANNSSNNFYETEGILTEVRTSLIKYASDASKEAYEEVLENYMADGAGAKLKYSERYMNGLIGKLTANSNFNVASKVNASNPSNSYREMRGEVWTKTEQLTRFPESVNYCPTEGESEDDAYVVFDIQYDVIKGYTLTLRDLKIDYTNEANYRSQIQTDIVFTTPDYKFDGDSTFNQLKNYLSISDGKLRVPDVTSFTASFTGNIYTGGAANLTSNAKPDTGIEIGQNKSVTFHAERIISRGSLDVQLGSEVTVSGDAGTGDSVPGDLWLQNIRLKTAGADPASSRKSILKIYENAYVSNDLDIEDNNSEVYLAGSYYGYSYNKENLSSAAATSAEYSSAVLVNGLNTSLFTNWDPSQGAPSAAGIPSLEKLVLAGHTFVERGTGSADEDIGMGESIAVKSDQIAYLVPDEYIIGVERNPVMSDEYTNKADFLADVKAALLNSPFKEYLDEDTPYIENYPKDLDGEAMYLFLRFKDSAWANEYFRKYFIEGLDSAVPEEDDGMTNKDLLKERAQTYLRTTNIGATFSPDLYLLAGYIVHNYDATGGNGLQSPDYFTSGDETGRPKENLLEDARKMANTYYSYCQSLTASSTSTGVVQRIEDGEERLVAERILTLDNLNVADVIRNAGGSADRSKVLVEAAEGDYTYNSSCSLLNNIPLGDNEKALLVAKGDVVVDAKFRGLIIAGGDVTVKEDFDGLILAQGQVDVTADNKTLTANIVAVNEVLDHIQQDPALTKIFNALNGTRTEDATEMEECIYFQNWEKDVVAAATE